MFMKKTQKSNINEDYNSFRAKKVKFLHQGGDSLQKSLKHERNSSISKEKPLNNVTLKDLCPEDKAKIGELVKKFALEKKEKEELLVKLEEKQRFFEESIKEIRKENEQVALESHELQEKFKHSINLLKTLQKNELNKENLQTQEKKSPFKENILNFAGGETYIDIFNKRSPCKKLVEKPLFSPKREIIRFSAGETERKLKSIEKNRKKTEIIQHNNYENEFDEKNSWEQEENAKTVNEIGILKEEIDNLAISLKKLKFCSPGENQHEVEEIDSNLNTPLEKSEKKQEDSKTLYFQNLFPNKNNPNKTKNNSKQPNKSKYDHKDHIKAQEKHSPAINIIDDYPLSSEDEDIELAKTWLNTKKTKLLQNSNDKNMFTQRNLSNLRDYLDKKLEDFDESEENIQKEDLSTPKPQRMIEQFKQPSFIENSQGFSQKSKLNHKYNDNDEIMDYIKKSLQNEVRNEINLNFNEVLEEKIKEFLLIKERVMPNEETMIKSKFDEKNKISLKSLEKKKNYSNKKKSKKKDENKKNKEAFEKNLNFQEKNLSNEYFPQNMKNLSNNIGYIQPNSPKEQEEITELLNYNEDFYENDLFDLIDEIDQEEFERNKTTKFNENQRAIQKTGGSLKEIIEENRNCMNSSYTETDQSIRYIKKQIKQMEESKKKEA